MMHQFVVGDGQPSTPINGDTEFLYEALKDQNYTVSKNGVGFVLEGLYWSRTYKGGFVLLNGQTFSMGDIYTIQTY